MEHQINLVSPFQSIFSPLNRFIMKQVYVLFLLLSCLFLQTAVAQTVPSPEKALELEKFTLLNTDLNEYVPLCPDIPCPCDGGLKEIQLYYAGANNVTVSFYYNGGLDPGSLISSFANVQDGDILVVQTPAGKTFNDYTFINVEGPGVEECKTRFWSNCPEYLYAGALDDLQIIGKTYGDFTVMGYTDADNNNSCSLDDIQQDWHVGGNLVESTLNTMGTINNESVSFITNNTPRGIITQAGNFGIGTQSPSTRLEVVGNSLFDGNVGMGISPSTDERLLVSGTSSLDGNVGIGIASPDDERLQVQGSSFLNGNVGIGVSSPVDERLQVEGTSFLDGNVGINKASTADFSLDVSGNANFEDRVKIAADDFPTLPDADLYNLAVGGGIIAEEVLVDKMPWADYVFEADYTLLSLEETEAYTLTKGHLPGVPSAEEVENNGLKLGEMQRVQMEKIEELYLHLFDMNKQMKALLEENEGLKKTVLEQSKKMEALKLELEARK
jgi:hypothetical protein